jgi:hypothetical protein
MFVKMATFLSSKHLSDRENTGIITVNANIVRFLGKIASIHPKLEAGDIIKLRLLVTNLKSTPKLTITEI